MIIVNDISKETGVSDSRAVYTPPCVVRISDLKQGAGLCATGSGDSDRCYANGSAASGTGQGCFSNGNNAHPSSGGCSGNGNSATPQCDSNGTSVP